MLSHLHDRHDGTKMGTRAPMCDENFSVLFNVVVDTNARTDNL